MLLWLIVAVVFLVTAAWVIADISVGGWGAVGSHLIWIGAIWVGALLFLMARGGLKRWRSVKRQDVPFAGYPEDHVLAVFSTPDDAQAATRELERAGLSNGRVKVFADAPGAASIDSEGTEHGVAGFAERELEHLVSDKDDLAEYETAVRRGATVLGVAVDKDERERVLDIFRRHHADGVRYFGRWAVETLEGGARGEPEPYDPERARDGV
jgi:hypothetical protein